MKIPVCVLPLDRDCRRERSAFCCLMAVALGAWAALCGGPAWAQNAGSVVNVPLTIDYIALNEALKQQMYTDQGRAPLWSGTNRCEYFYAQNPQFSRIGERVKLETDASLSIGVAVGSQCISPIQWTGIIEAEMRPYMAPAMLLKFDVEDINLYNQRHEKTLIAGKGFDLVKQYFIPRLQTFSFDLNPATQQLDDLAQQAAPPEVAERVKSTLATLAVKPQLEALDNGVRATLTMQLPSFPSPSATPSAPSQLPPEELAAFEQELDQWDAFLVFSIKQIGDLGLDPKLRGELLDVLLDSRHRLLQALANPQSGAPDPVRVLFLAEWQRLDEIVREAARRGTLGDRSLQFLSFISAGDALFALDQAAPALGMKISAEDLRRLAHVIAPQVKTDPLAFSFEEDPQLQRMFKVARPLESEGPLEAGPTTIATPTPSSSAGASPTATATGSATPTPSATPSPRATSTTPTPTSSAGAAHPSAWLDLPMRLMVPNDARAAETVPVSTNIAAQLQKLGRKLKRTVVRDDNVDEYRNDMDRLLELTAEREMSEEEIAQQQHTLYIRLAKSTAWQESCWRQFAVKGNRIVYLESSSHDIGLMQVNKYVWRGFYNASGGMEIIARLLKRVGDKPGAVSPGKPDELARSVYAAYNGGPESYRRWRRDESRETRLIDQAFWAKYQAVSRGQRIDIPSCAADWGRTPGH
jgi:hypothetical protein